MDRKRRFSLESVLMAFPATQIRRGMVLVFEGDPCRVIEFRHHTPGNLRAMVQAKLKNLRSGSSFEHRFRAADTIEKASMETHDLEFLYQGGDTYHFMNTENYDQLEMDEEALGDNAQWMQPSMRIQAEFYDGRAVGIRLRSEERRGGKECRMRRSAGSRRKQSGRFPAGPAPSACRDR